jgi:hypothetical protein
MYNERLFTQLNIETEFHSTVKFRFSTRNLIRINSKNNKIKKLKSIWIYKIRFNSNQVLKKINTFIYFD